MNKRTITLAVLATLCVTSASFAQQDSSPIAGLQVHQGVRADFTAKNKFGLQSYRKITYRGNMIDEQGKKLAPLEINKEFALTGTSFTPEFLLDFETGEGNIKQETLNLYGINTIRVPKVLFKGLNSISRLSGTMDGKQTYLGFGLETKPLHPASGKGINHFANWLYVGVNAEQWWRDPSIGSNETLATANYRFFLGKGTFSQRDESGLEATLEMEKVDEYVKTWSFKQIKSIGDKTLEELKTELKDNMRADRLFNFCNDVTADPNDPALGGNLNRFDPYKQCRENPNIEFKDILRQKYVEKQKYKNMGNRFQLASKLRLESEGSYALSSKQANRRLRSILALTYTGSFGQKSSGAPSFDFRYENGYDRAAPKTQVNRLTASVTFNF
jgi:hypothetical protein